MVPSFCSSKSNSGSCCSMQSIAMVLVVTGNSFMLLDSKSLSMKYRVELQHIKQISLSSYSDQIFIIHLEPVSGNKFGMGNRAV